jgi:hypothetical protein
MQSAYRSNIINPIVGTPTFKKPPWVCVSTFIICTKKRCHWALTSTCLSAKRSHHTSLVGLWRPEALTGASTEKGGGHRHEIRCIGDAERSIWWAQSDGGISILRSRSDGGRSIWQWIKGVTSRRIPSHRVGAHLLELRRLTSCLRHKTSCCIYCS